MKAAIKPATLAAVSYIAANLRDRDVVEFRASLGQLNIPDTIAAIVQASGVHAFVCWVDDQPAFVFGVLANAMVPHIAQAWGYGTSAAWKAIPAAGRFIQQALIPDLLAVGVHRV